MSARETYAGHTSDLSRLSMRSGGGLRNSIPLAYPNRGIANAVASSRVQETTMHPFMQLLRDIACLLSLSLFLIALGVVAAIVRALVFNPF